MFARSPWKPMLLAGFGLALSGCTNNLVDSISVSPATQSLSVGQSAQFAATALQSHGKHPSSSSNVTSQVAWTSSAPAVATVSASGLATAVSAGTATVSATMQGFGGPVTGTAVITVTSSGSVSTEPLASLAIDPGSQTAVAVNQSVDFLAIGTTGAGATVNLTGQTATVGAATIKAATWTSSDPAIAKVDANTGIATALTSGSTTISAQAVNSDGTIVIGNATLTVTLPAGSAEQYTAVTIIPNTQALSASGQTSQFIALGTQGTSGLQVDVTNSPQIKWSTDAPSIASISATGLASGASVGTATITAELTNPDSTVVTSSATVNVSLTAAPEPLLSLNIIPSSITVGNLQDTGNFLAIGTFSTVPYVRDLTNSPGTTWISSAPEVFPVTTNSGGNAGASAGTVTAYGNGTATIIAEATSADGTIQTATATFNCPLVLPNPPLTPGSCFQGSQASGLLVTLTVYNEGLNTSNWIVTAPSATATPNVIHCGPGWAANGGAGGSVCTATYPLNTTVTLTATQVPGSTATFGGWSYNCAPQQTVTADGPNTCQITLGNADGITGNSNVTVGAIFN